MKTLGPDEKVCPYCAETIKAAAVKCRYCQSDLPPGDLSVDEQSETPPPPPEVPRPRRRFDLASFALLRVLVAACLVLALLTGIAWWFSQRQTDSSAADGPITSAQARDAGLQVATQLTEKILSYDWKTLAEDTKAAEAVMAPSFRAEYTKAMAKVKDQTIKNQVKLEAKAVATSVVSASEHKVVALVFVNQITTAKGTDNQRLDQNRVLVTLTRDEGDWRVSKMDAF